MRVINVIEVEDNVVLGVDSFCIFEDQLSQDVVDEAEDTFVEKLKENGCLVDNDEINEILDGGYWSSGSYSINIVWSEI